MQTHSPTPPSSETPKSNNVMTKFLDAVERLGNLLPHPVILFLGLYSWHPGRPYGTYLF
jgi:hypothetical protein